MLRRVVPGVRVTSIASALCFALLGCENSQTEPATELPQNPQLPPGLAPRFGALAGRLPSTDTVTSSVPAFEIKQKGGGIAGRFEITNPNSAAIALDGVSSGTGHALLAWNLGLGRAAVVITSNSNNTLPALDVSSQSRGVVPSGSSVGLAAGMDVRANNTAATSYAGRIRNLGLGTTFHIETVNTQSVSPALEVETNARATVMRLNQQNTQGGSLALFQYRGANKIRFTRGGKGFFEGGTQTGGADVAELFAVEGAVREYQPGDVLIISDDQDRHVELANEPYSSRVIGVYATKPGVVLTERSIDARTDDMVPVGVIGVIPTKVSAENGAIRRGDLLVTANTKGHAMLGTQRDGMLGAVLGKALAEFSGPGTGVIPVLVNVK